MKLFLEFLNKTNLLKYLSKEKHRKLKLNKSGVAKHLNLNHFKFLDSLAPLFETHLHHYIHLFIIFHQLLHYKLVGHHNYLDKIVIFSLFIFSSQSPNFSSRCNFLLNVVSAVFPSDVASTFLNLAPLALR